MFFPGFSCCPRKATWTNDNLCRSVVRTTTTKPGERNNKWEVEKFCRRRAYCQARPGHKKQTSMAIRRQKESSMRKKKSVKKSSRTKRTRDKTKTARGKVQGTDFIAAIMPVDQLADGWGEGGSGPKKVSHMPATTSGKTKPVAASRGWWAVGGD